MLSFTDWLNSRNLSASDGTYARWLGYIDNYYLGEA